MSGTVEFCGEQFTLADKIGMMPMMRLARVQQRVTGQAEISDADGAELLAAMLDVVEQGLASEDWARFEQVATANRVDVDEIHEFTDRVMRAIAARPTGRSSDSSDGPRIIEPSSTEDSSSPVIHRLNEQGRPDLALLVRKRQESLTA